MTYSSGSTAISMSGWGPVLQPLIEVPVLRGEGPPAWSTNTDLVPEDLVINDTNFYYRVLGFEWPFRGITKRMLMQAYRDRNGPNDPYKTLAFKMLLDDEKRRLYHRVPIGQRLIDACVWEEIMNKAKGVVFAAMAQGRELALTDVLSSWGIGTSPIPGPDETEPNEPVTDTDQPLSDIERDPSVATEGDASVPATWSWGYYLWRSACGDDERLARWQNLLLAASRELNLRVRLAVGFVGRTPQEWVIGQSQDCFVIFLNEGTEPDGELAAAAVDHVIQMIN